MTFGGTTYDATLDKKRLKTQLECVEELMSDGQWRGLLDIVQELWKRYRIRATEAGVSARLRDLRKPAFGAHTIETKRVAGGYWQSRMIAENKQLELSV